MQRRSVRPRDGPHFIATIVPDVFVEQSSLDCGHDGKMTRLVQQVAGVPDCGVIHHERATRHGDTGQHGSDGDGLLNYVEVDAAKKADNRDDELRVREGRGFVVG